uniref:Uncharacterized protein n=1 Tax=Aegilops tauschii subsp. strangulata TaxID=200361 RepID=A0A453A2Z4_AEGTS
PFARWVARLETRRQGFRGFDGLQVLALLAVEAFLMVCSVSNNLVQVNQLVSI